MVNFEYLVANSLVESYFPYPFAFTTCFNLGIMVLTVLLALVILNIIIIITRLFSKLLGN